MRTSLLIISLVLGTGLVHQPAWGQLQRRGRASAVRLVPATRDIELPIVDGAVIRSQKVPVLHDAKGKTRKPDPEERKKLRGPDPKMPGYAAQLNDLAVGQIVRVYLGRRKPPKEEAAAEAKPAENPQRPDPDQWNKLGELVGVIAKTPKAAAGAGDAGADQQRKLTLRIETVSLSGARRGASGTSNAGKAAVGKGVVVYRVIILSDTKAKPEAEEKPRN